MPQTGLCLQVNLCSYQPNSGCRLPTGCPAWNALYSLAFARQRRPQAPCSASQAEESVVYNDGNTIFDMWMEGKGCKAPGARQLAG